MRVPAPAKINLHLRVGPPREDGFHPLLSWMATAGLFDTLTFVRQGHSRAADGDEVVLVSEGVGYGPRHGAEARMKPEFLILVRRVRKLLTVANTQPTTPRPSRSAAPLVDVAPLDKTPPSAR